MELEGDEIEFVQQLGEGIQAARSLRDDLAVDQKVVPRDADDDAVSLLERRLHFLNRVAQRLRNRRVAWRVDRSLLVGAIEPRGSHPPRDVLPGLEFAFRILPRVQQEISFPPRTKSNRNKQKSFSPDSSQEIEQICPVI
jgi:hypothetical protein